VAGLANTLGITTTAEGVETEAQLRQIRAEGCTEAQGYLFSRPVNAGDLLPMLEARESAFYAVA
jgi:EAL domain-containing protein (putative c-di-GMP-specific phosphodiesterase class I)